MGCFHSNNHRNHSRDLASCVQVRPALRYQHTSFISFETRLYLRDMICGMYGVLSKRLRPNGRSSVQRTRASSCKFFRDILSPTRSEPCLPTHYTSNGQSMQNSADALGTRDPISPIPAVHWPDRPHHWCQAGTGETTDGRHLPVAFDDPERTTHDVVFPHDNKAGLPKYGESDWTPPSSAEKWRSERPPPYVRNGQDTIDLQGGGGGLPHGTKADDAQYDQGHMLTLPPPTHPLSHD